MSIMMLCIVFFRFFFRPHVCFSINIELRFFLSRMFIFCFSQKGSLSNISVLWCNSYFMARI